MLNNAKHNHALPKTSTNNKRRRLRVCKGKMNNPYSDSCSLSRLPRPTGNNPLALRTQQISLLRERVKTQSSLCKNNRILPKILPQTRLRACIKPLLLYFLRILLYFFVANLEGTLVSKLDKYDAKSISAADLLPILFNASATLTKASTCRVKERLQRNFISARTLFTPNCLTECSILLFKFPAAINSNCSESRRSTLLNWSASLDSAIISSPLLLTLQAALHHSDAENRI